MTQEILLNKFESLERCVHRIREEYHACNGDIEHDILRQDSIILNLERACEQTIAIGQYIVRSKKLGMPKEYRDVFILLEQEKMISHDMSQHLQKMVGFRNIAVHEYKSLSIDILKHIIAHRLDELMDFGRMSLTL